MKTPVFHFVFLALLGSFLTPLAVAYALPSPADSVHFFCQIIDPEEWERERALLPAAKRLQDLNVGEPRTVRLLYFLPNDRPYRADVVQNMKTQILEIQTFYAEQMAVHGHGNKTFQIETDDQGEPIVHRVDGQYPASNYENGPTGEIQQVFDIEANIYFIVFDIGSNAFGHGPLGQALQTTKNGGHASVTDEFSFKTAAHELGHTFGLYHDFRDNAYIMSYGQEPSQLSECAAEFLAVHTYFNSDSPVERTSPPTIELISPTEYPAGSESVSVQLRTTDSDGLHQVIPFVLTKNIFFNANFPEVKTCYGLGSKTETVVVYDYDGDIPSDDYTSFASTPSHLLRAMVVDTDGNQTWTSFTLREASSYHIATLEGHTNDVQSVAFSPDGMTLASGARDRTILLWNVPTRASIGTLEGGGDVQSVAFSPDGMTLASGGGGTKLWDVATRANINTLEEGGGVQSVAFSPDGTTLASGGGGTKLWDVATRANINTLEEHTVWDVAFSPDGMTLASGGVNSAVNLWDVATGVNIATFEHTSWVNSVAFSPNGTLLASSSGREIRLWDVATGANIATLWGHTYGIWSVAFAPDGATIASGSGDGTIRLWDVLTREELAVFPSGSPSVAFSPDGTMLASGSYDNTVELWDTSEWTQPRLHRVVRISGDNQQGTPDAALANPLIVEARDQYGNPLPDAQVTFTVTAGGGQLSGWFTIEHATTNANGRAELTFTLGPYAGTNTVGVSVAGRELVTFNAMGIGTPTVSVMDGDYRTWSLPDGAIARLGKGSFGETDRAIALSPDRQHLAVASSIGVWLYDVTTGRELALLPTANVQSVAFSPDGTTLASKGVGDIVLWDVATGTQINTFEGWTPVFSPDGTILASGLYDATVRLWDTATGANIATLEGHTNNVLSMAFSPDGTMLASGSYDNTVRLWDMATRTSIATLEGHTYQVNSVSFSPDGKILASGSGREVRLWDVATRANVATLEEHGWTVSSVAFSSDGTTLASGSWDSTVKLWNVVTGANIATLEGHTGEVYSVAFSPDGTTLASGSGTEVKLWDMATGSVAILSGHTDEVFSVAFSPDRTTLASGHTDGMIRLWDMATGSVAILPEQRSEVFSVAFSPDGTTLASGALNDYSRLWDVAMGTEIATLGYSGWSVAFSPDGTTLASGHTDNTIKLWDVATGTQINTFEGHANWVKSVAFSPDGTMLASGSYDNTVKLWDMATNTNSATLYEGRVKSVAFSPDGATLASESGIEVKLWDMATNTNSATLSGGRVKSVAFSPDGAILASGSGSEVKLWDMATNTNSATLSGHTDEIKSVAFSPDAATLASGSDDGTILLWDTSEWTTPPVVNRPPTGVVTISGTAEVGEPLTADASAVMDPDGPETLQFSYQWLADASPIADATSQTYTLTANEIGKKIRVRVSYIDGLGALVNITSGETEIVSAGICDRTEKVQTAILNLIAGVSDCALVTGTHLAGITEMVYGGTVKAGDFDGLTGLTNFKLSLEQSSLPAGMFNDLSNLTYLGIASEQLTTLSAGTFRGLTSLTDLYLEVMATSLPAGVFDPLTSLTSLDLYADNLSTLPDGIFDQVTKLTSLSLGGTELTNLPDSLFYGLSSLQGLQLSRNAVDPLPLIVSLEKVGNDQFKAVAPSGAPFDIVLPLSVRNGSIDGATTITIPVGSAESQSLSVVRTPGTTGAVTVDIGTLPGLPTDHSGYALVKSSGLPLEVISRTTEFTPVCDRTPQVRDKIVEQSPVSACGDVTEAHLAAITVFGLGRITILGETAGEEITALQAGDFDGLTGLTTLYVGGGEQLSSIPAGIFDELISLETLFLTGNFSSLPDDVFDGLTSLTALSVGGNFSSLPDDVFDQLTGLTALVVFGVQLHSLPDDVFDKLTGLTTLYVGGNFSSLPDDVFDQLTGLTTLSVVGSFSSLPDGVFDGLTSLTALVLQGNLDLSGITSLADLEELDPNVVDPLLLTVSLEQVGEGQFKAVTPTGAPFEMVLPLTVASGSISGGATTITIPAGSVESAPLTVTRTPGTTFAVTVGIGTLPELPNGHSGYALVKSADLPLVFTEFGGPVLTPVCDRTPQVQTAILGVLQLQTPSPSTCGEVTEAHLATGITSLFLNDQSITALQAGDFDGLTSLTELRLNGNQLTTLPEDIFDGLTSLTELRLNNNQLTTLPAGIFDELTLLRGLWLYGNQLTTLPEGIFDGLTALTTLNLSSNQLTTLPAGIFDGLALTTLRIRYNSSLSSLPAGIFEGVTTLTWVYLDGNAVNPLPLTVSLEKVGEDQFKAIAPTGAPFDIVLPISVANGSISGGATTLTIPIGSVESEPLTVTRTPSTTFAVTVDIGTLPGRPQNHLGYELIKSADLPLEMFSRLAGGITPVCDRTPQVRDEIVAAVSGVSNCRNVTEAHLAAITILDLQRKGITALKAGDFDGLNSLIRLWLRYNELSTLPVGIFDGLTSLTTLYLNSNALTSLPEGIFDGLTELRDLHLSDNALTSLPEGIFDGLAELRLIWLSGNALTSLPEGIFDGLTEPLIELVLSGNAVNPLPLTVSLEKVGTNQFKAVAPSGVPFDIVLPLTITNGSITGGASTLTIPVGSMESETLTVTRTPDTTFAVTVNIGDPLPVLSGRHQGFALVKSSDLPLVLTELGGDILTPVSERTPQVRDAIVAAVPGVNSADDVTEAHLAAITGTLGVTYANLSTLKPGDFSGLSSLTSLRLWGNQLTTLPAGVFSGLSSLISLNLTNNRMTSLPKGVFSDLSSLTALSMGLNRFTSLEAGVFSGLSSLTSLELHGNQFTTFDANIFSDLPSLKTLNLHENQFRTLDGNVFSRLSSLERLYLHGNQIATLEAGDFSGLPPLKALRLEGALGDCYGFGGCF